MKKLFATTLFALAALLTAAAAETNSPAPPKMTETGDAAPELAGAWSKGNPVKLADERGKNVVVLYFWSVNQASLEDMPRFAETVRKFQGKPVVFAGVGCDRPDKVAGFFRVRELPIPMLIDDRSAAKSGFLPPNVRLPAAVIVDKEGRLVWRGAPAALPGVLGKVLDGTFDLKEHIRREKFARKVGAALAKDHYEEAVALIDEELKIHPANVELVSTKATILARALKQPELAVKAMDEALRTAPKSVAFHEIKMKLLFDMRDEAGLKNFYRELCKTFADAPLVLARFAMVEMERPLVDNRPELYAMLMTAAHESKNFRDDRERGIVELHYSRMLMTCGCPKPAVAAAERAVKLLADAPERKEAEAVLAFNRRIAEAAKSLD
jgi:peroxiredoxin